MTSSLQHAAKFRWTEKLTCRFIQLRRDHAKMFTGRKYSAQQGWEYILRQMRQEFPAIMADVHYRVLKKKWSNLLQQYKELRNPVHGDKNRADDISWPFYAAIDEVIASLGLSPANNPRRRRGASCISGINEPRHDNNKRHPNRIDETEDDDDEELDEDDLNPQEFLCVSVSTDETTSTPPIDYERTASAMQQSLDRRTSRTLLSRLPRATELTIRPAAAAVKRNNQEISRASNSTTATGDNSDDGEGSEENGTATATTRRGRKSCRRQDEGLERRIVEFMEYTKKRDEENRSILMRMLEALEDIRNAALR